MFREESATEQQLENEKAALDVARSEYRASLDNYQTGLSRVNDYKTQRAGLSSEIKRRQSVSSRDSLYVSYTVITAPYNGKMGRKTIQTGQFIQTNQTLAFIVNLEAEKWVIANFKETQVGHMYIGQEAEIEADAFPGEVFKGKVESLSPATGSSFSVLPPDNSTGNFVKIVQRIPVRVTLISPADGIGKLRAGMNATVRIKK